MADQTRDWLGHLRGRFLVFDGPDGCGKTTQWRRFAKTVETARVPVCQVREPGGTDIGEQIRQILLDPAHGQTVNVRCEMLLFMASRAQLVEQRIKPALAAGELVLADRFISSTLAYQGTAGGLALDAIRHVAQVAVGSCGPDLVVIFDVDEATSAARLAGKPTRSKYANVTEPTLFSDRIELKGAEFQRAVRHGYLEQAEADPDHHLVVDAGKDEDEVFELLLAAVRRKFCGNQEGAD